MESVGWSTGRRYCWISSATLLTGEALTTFSMRDLASMVASHLPGIGEARLRRNRTTQSSSWQASRALTGTSSSTALDYLPVQSGTPSCGAGRQAHVALPEMLSVLHPQSLTCSTQNGVVSRSYLRIGFIRAKFSSAFFFVFPPSLPRPVQVSCGLSVLVVFFAASRLSSQWNGTASELLLYRGGRRTIVKYFAPFVSS